VLVDRCCAGAELTGSVCCVVHRSEMGVLGRVCRHCKLDEGMRTWEARLFQLSTKALAAGTQVRQGRTGAACGAYSVAPAAVCQ
jgi:hypothetical protein